MGRVFCEVLSDRPIGMFDSGFGGLTVARAAIDLLPAEDLVYLGDTGRYPYGSKPHEEVRAHALEIGQHLVESYDIKMLVVACNTATAAGLTALRDTLPVPVLGVIEPGVRAVLQATERHRVGVIATVGTIDSGAYEDAVGKEDALVDLTTCACPGFVEFVERGTTSGPQIKILAERLLAPVIDADVDALLLGCTHYPYLARVISEVMGPEVVLVSSADETAFALADLMHTSGLEHPDRTRTGTHTFISSGDVRAFTAIGSRLLGPELVNAERWEPCD